VGLVQGQYLYLQYQTDLDSFQCCRARAHRLKFCQNRFPHPLQELLVKVREVLTSDLRQLLRGQQPFLTLLLPPRLLLLLRLRVCLPV
jgi:hypothetical protein